MPEATIPQGGLPDELTPAETAETRARHRAEVREAFVAAAIAGLTSRPGNTPHAKIAADAIDIADRAIELMKI